MKETKRNRKITSFLGDWRPVDTQSSKEEGPLTIKRARIATGYRWQEINRFDLVSDDTAVLYLQNGEVLRLKRDGGRGLVVSNEAGDRMLERVA